MVLAGPDQNETQRPTDMYVFDQIVILRQASTGRFFFYEKPLVENFVANPLPFNITEGIDYDPSMVSYGWVQSNLNPFEYTLFGITA